MTETSQVTAQSEAVEVFDPDILEIKVEVDDSSRRQSLPPPLSTMDTPLPTGRSATLDNTCIISSGRSATLDKMCIISTGRSATLDHT